jgi:hypothetical protein
LGVPRFARRDYSGVPGLPDRLVRRLDYLAISLRLVERHRAGGLSADAADSIALPQSREAGQAPGLPAGRVYRVEQKWLSPDSDQPLETSRDCHATAPDKTMYREIWKRDPCRIPLNPQDHLPPFASLPETAPGMLAVSFAALVVVLWVFFMV